MGIGCKDGTTISVAIVEHLARQLSNRGLAVYDEFQEVVVLSNMHRLRMLDEVADPDNSAFNARCVLFAQIMLRLRDMTLTHEDYFWLCKFYYL